MTHFLREWAVYAAGITFWVCFTWPAVVRLFWPWHQSMWGWNMVIKTEMIALALLTTVLKTEFGVEPGVGLEWVEVAAVTLIPVIIIWRTWLIYRDQKAGVSQSSAAERERDRAGDG
jgi:hypothetical protein